MSLDWRGYYQALDLSPGASNDEIRAAWRRMARQWHPDQTPHQDTTARFQAISEAYETLSDPEKRRLYDEESLRRQQTIRPGRPGPANTDSAPGTPLVAVHVCSGCQCLSAQLRVVSFYRVYGLLITTKTKRQTAILCPRCALARGFQTNLQNWVVGWWGFPAGPFRVLEYGFINMRGGQLRRTETVSLLIQQAQAFSQTGQIKLANGLFQAALDLAPDREQSRQLTQLRTRLLGQTAPTRLKNQWRFIGKKLYIIQMIFHLGLCLSMLAGLLLLGHAAGLWQGLRHFWTF